MIDHFLDDAYCQRLIDSALAGGGTDDTTMRQSSAPAPQLDLSWRALWPLVPLVLFAAVPSAMHAAEDGGNVLFACIRAWGVASSIVLGFGWAVPKLRGLVSVQSRTSSGAMLGDQELVEELLQKVDYAAVELPHCTAPHHTA